MTCPAGNTLSDNPQDASPTEQSAHNRMALTLAEMLGLKNSQVPGLALLLKVHAEEIIRIRAEESHQ